MSDTSSDSDAGHYSENLKMDYDMRSQTSSDEEIIASDKEWIGYNEKEIEVDNALEPQEKARL